MNTTALRRSSAAFLVVVIAAAVFWRTAYPTITWWDSSEYSTAAGTLGVISSPGSLLLTLLGWPISHLPFGSSPAHLLNLFAGVLAAITVGLVFLLALRMLAPPHLAAELGLAPIAGAGLGALAFAFSDTLWDHAIKFTPYVLTAVFTGLILWTMLRWWQEADQPNAWRRLALLGLLFGLDFSVHRTNALLMPGVLVWILLRHPGTLRAPRAWLGGAGGLIAGLAVQLLIIPIAASTRSSLNVGDPSTLPRFWDYISLAQRGGGFLVQFFPRNAPFWSVQVADLLRVLGANFFSVTGPAGVLGILPGLAAVGGLVALWRANRRLAVALSCVLFLHMAATVLYFNIPAQYFRSFDRHYLPVCVTIAVLAAYGVAAGLQLVTAALRTRPRAFAIAMTSLAALVPVGQLIGNWQSHEAANRYFARDFAANALQTLPPHAIVFTAGDNDTFPLLYLQDLEGLRRDVTVINVSLSNLPGFTKLVQRREPAFPAAMSDADRATWARRGDSDTTVAIPVTGTREALGVAPGAEIPTSIVVHVKPQYAAVMFPSEITLVDIVQTNEWRRPLCALRTVGELVGWLKPYARPDGLFWRIVPLEQPRPDEALLRANLLEHSQYRGYADAHVRIDGFSGVIGSLYHAAIKPLLAADQARGDNAACRDDANTLIAAVPPRRLNLSADARQDIESPCLTNSSRTR